MPKFYIQYAYSILETAEIEAETKGDALDILDQRFDDGLLPETEGEDAFLEVLDVEVEMEESKE